MNPQQLYHQYLTWFYLKCSSCHFFAKNAYSSAPLMTICFCKIVNIFTTRITNNLEDTSLNIKLNVYITAYIKSFYRTCTITIFIHHPLDVFPHILKMFHFMKCMWTPQKKGRTSVIVHNYIYIYIMILCLTTGESHSPGFYYSTD